MIFLERAHPIQKRLFRMAMLCLMVFVFCSPAMAWKRPPVIDFHTHLDARAAVRIAQIMQASGIERMVNLSGGNPSGGMRGAIALARQMPHRIVNFYTLDWSDREEPWWAVREAQRLETAVKQFGYKGLKISKALGLYIRNTVGMLMDVDDPRLDPIWERAGELGIPVSIHTGDPKAFWEPLTPANERFAELQHHPSWSFHDQPVPSRNALLRQRDRLIARHPETTFVCVHFANNPESLAYVWQLLDRHLNVWVDIAARVPEIGRHPAQMVRDLFIKHQDRIVFGTDIGISPASLMLGSTGGNQPSDEDALIFYKTHWRFLESGDRGFAHPTPIQGKWLINGIELPRAVLNKIYRSNALKLLGVRE
ncbi:MAG TPA: amidohydrolase [Myxococcales bacterium]|nr:amidohydrolase [Myxococcales bacterium]